jgi:hypothetical protein
MDFFQNIDSFLKRLILLKSQIEYKTYSFYIFTIFALTCFDSFFGSYFFSIVQRRHIRICFHFKFGLCSLLMHPFSNFCLPAVLLVLVCIVIETASFVDILFCYCLKIVVVQLHNKHLKSFCELTEWRSFDFCSQFLFICVSPSLVGYLFCALCLFFFRFLAFYASTVYILRDCHVSCYKLIFYKISCNYLD